MLLLLPLPEKKDSSSLTAVSLPPFLSMPIWACLSSLLCVKVCVCVCVCVSASKKVFAKSALCSLLLFILKVEEEENGN